MNPEQINRSIILEKLNLDNNNNNNLYLDIKKNQNISESTIIDNTINTSDTENNFQLLSLEKDNLLSQEPNLHYLSRLPCISSSNKNDKDIPKISNYIYYLNNVLSDNIKYLKSDKQIHLCIYNIINQDNNLPFLLYLLNKDKQNKLYFPHFFTTKNIFEEAEEKIKIIFNTYNSMPIIKGFKESTNNIYIYYEFINDYKLEKINYHDEWWWSGINEIIDTKTLLNFKIDKTVYKIFEKYPLLACLYDDNNNKFQIPYILYYGSYSNYATFISVFGLPKQSPSSNLGPYYYFYTYHGAGKSGIWSYNRKEQIANDIEITRNEYGVYNHGGLIRFAIFGNNMKYFLNNDDDPDDLSEISQQLAKEKDFYKQTLKLRDSNSEWANNHDIAYIGSSMIKSIVRGEEIKRKYTIQFAVRDYYQHVPLTYHYINTDKFSIIKGEEAISKPFNYKSYDIE